MTIPLVPFTIPEVVAAGVAFGAVGYTLQEVLISRHKLRPSTLPRPERRHHERALIARDSPLEQQAEDLMAAIDVMVHFVDGPARAHRARSCAKQISALVPAEHRGAMTTRFISLVEAEAPPAEIQRAAEEVCLQMANELRGILGRSEIDPEQKTLTLEHLRSAEDDVRAAEAAAEARAVQEPAGALYVHIEEPDAVAPPPRPAWAIAEAEIADLAVDAAALPDRKPRDEASAGAVGPAEVAAEPDEAAPAKPRRRRPAKAAADAAEAEPARQRRRARTAAPRRRSPATTRKDPEATTPAVDALEAVDTPESPTATDGREQSRAEEPAAT